MKLNNLKGGLFTYPLDKKNKYVMLDPASINIPLSELDNRVTFFKIHDKDIENIFFSNDGYILRATENSYEKYYPNKQTDMILCEGKEFSIIDLYKEFYFKKDAGNTLLPVNGAKFDSYAVRDINIVDPDEFNDFYHTWVSDVEEFTDADGNIKYKAKLNPKEAFEKVKAFKGPKKYPYYKNTSLALFGLYGANSKPDQVLTGMKNRPKQKKRKAKRCPEWTSTGRTRREDYIVKERIKLWTIANYYYYPGSLSNDKDLLCLWSGDLIYSPQTCMFIPSDINTFFSDVVCKQIETGIYRSDKEQGKIIDKIRFYIKRETALEKDINHDAHTKMIAVLKDILTKIES